MEKLKSFLNKPCAIVEPMMKSCRVGVVIPVYDEKDELVERLLSSFLLQDCDFDEFELAFVVNNSQDEVRQKTSAYQQNRKILELLKYLAGENLNSPAYFSSEELSKWEKIRLSGLHIKIIDASSEFFAPKENNAGVARGKGGDEMVRRFATVPAGLKGIIALLDCDTSVSSGFISGIIAAFNQRKSLNGIAGIFAIEFPPAIKNQEIFFQAYQTFAGNKLWLSDEAELNFLLHIKNKTHVELGQFLITGQNMAITARAWTAAGGFPKWHLWEDFEFGRRIEQLNGEVAMVGSYYIKTLIRPSTRTGFNALGRTVNFISGQVNDYVDGKSKVIMVPNQRMLNNAVSLMLFKANQEIPSVDFIEKILQKHNFLNESTHGIKARALAESLLLDCRLPQKDRTYRNFNQAIIIHMHPNTPLIAVNL